MSQFRPGIPMNSWLCLYCKHMAMKIKNDSYICEAFPEGIPWEILEENFDHRNPFPDDNGIQFEIDERFAPLPDEVDEHYEKRKFQSDDEDMDHSKE